MRHLKLFNKSTIYTLTKQIQPQPTESLAFLICLNFIGCFACISARVAFKIIEMHSVSQALSLNSVPLSSSSSSVEVLIGEGGITVVIWQVSTDCL